MEFHPTDYEQYVKITGNDPTQEAYEAYGQLVLVRHMFESGPVGYDHLIIMVRDLDIPFRASPVPKKVVLDANWDSLPDDGSVMVEVFMYGGWQPARYRGRVEGGTLAVEMGDNPGVLVELARSPGDLVRIIQQDPFTGVVSEEDDDMDARAKAFEEAEKNYIPTGEEPSDFDEEEDVVPTMSIEDTDTDWGSGKKGEAVYLETESGESVSGQFVSMSRVKMRVEDSEDEVEVLRIMATPDGDSGPIEYFEDQVTVVGTFADLSAVAAPE